MTIQTSGVPLLLVLSLVFSTGCYSYWGGFWPPVERLTELQPGVSSSADVEALLGAPLGRGMARLTPDSPESEVWIYGRFGYPGYGTSFRSAQLMVFLKEGRYDGHFWLTVGKPPAPATGHQP